MTVERLIKQLEKFNPKAEVRLNEAYGSTALFALALVDSSNNKDLSNLFKIYPPLGSTFDIEYLKGLSQLKDFNLPMESYIYFKDNEIVEN